MTTSAFLDDHLLSWESVLDAFLEHGFVESTVFSSAIEVLPNESASSIRHVAILSLCSALSIHEKEQSIQRVHQILPTISFQQYGWGLLYQQIIFDLFELKTPEVDYTTIESNPHDLISYIEILLLKIFIGHFFGKETLLEKSLHEAQWLLRLVDHDSHFLGTYWFSDCMLDQKTIQYSLYYLNRVLDTFHLQETAKKKVSSNKKVQETLQLNCIRFLSELIQRQSITKKRPPLSAVQIQELDTKYGIATIHFNQFSAVIDHPGQSQSIGAFCLNRLFFPAFGPHYFPLGEMNLFGAKRHPDSNLYLKEEEKQDRCWTFWSRLPTLYAQKKRQIGSRWIQIDFFTHDEGVDLSITKADLEEIPPFSFVFFVCAENLKIEQWGEIQKLSLQRYQDISRSVYLSKKQEVIQIQPLFETEMQIIPLNGESHFWGASYLISYVMSPESKKLAWRILNK